ncbi:MAG: hypothetical protein OXG08_00100 [Gammaproteobacteria bacterium]|nr:hypothetical protein [Gammaproteobacteria bacterium]
MVAGDLMSFSQLRIRLANQFDLLKHAAIANAGHRFWLIPILVPIIWLGPQSFFLAMGWTQPVQPSAIQVRMMGFPLACVGIYLGLRIIAGEINARTLEIVYTVPGGAVKVWLIKLLAAIMILLPTQIIIGVYSWFMFTPFPLESLYGALQIGVFYLVVSLGFSTLFRSEVSGAIVAVAALGLNVVITGFGTGRQVWTPFFNPHVIDNESFRTILAMTLQNRIGMALVIIMIISLAFLRGNRRERLLSG